MPIDLLASRSWTAGAGHVIRPATAFDADKLSTVPEHRAIAISISYPPPPGMKNWFFALMAKLVEAGVFETVDKARTAILIRTGRVESWVARGDEIEFRPVSMQGWEGPEWRSFLDDAVRVVLTEIVPGMKRADLRALVERYVGATISDALEVERG